MILLDTNVLSELLRPSPSPRIVNWISGQPRSSLFTSAIVRAEILYGIHLLPEGQRKTGLRHAALAIFNDAFAGQVLSFDADAADAYAEIGAARTFVGKPISQFDAMIAGIARSRGAMLATRNAKDFEGCGLDVINPWSSGTAD